MSGVSEKKVSLWQRNLAIGFAAVVFPRSHKIRGGADGEVPERRHVERGQLLSSEEIENQIPWQMNRLLALLAVLFALAAPACTNLLVGKKASKNGACFITYSADSYGMYGRMLHYPAGKHAPGTMRKIVDGDTHKPLGEIPEAPYTYNVVGNINEHQVAITETTFGGREELWPKNPVGGIDYVSLMALGLQRAKTAREAIRVMTDLVARYGYASEGESFSVADPNEAWILEMIGKGDSAKGAVWVAVRIPDDCISAHANQSRIHRFNLKDKKNVMYARDVISFARSKGYFKGHDDEFSFSDAFAPADFSSQRFCEARVWSLFNHFTTGMDKYVPFVDGKHIGTSEVMPLYVKPTQLLSLEDVMSAMRDHYENTPFDGTKDAGSGVGCSLSPLAVDVGARRREILQRTPRFDPPSQFRHRVRTAWQHAQCCGCRAVVCQRRCQHHAVCPRLLLAHQSA